MRNFADQLVQQITDGHQAAFRRTLSTTPVLILHQMDGPTLDGPPIAYDAARGWLLVNGDAPLDSIVRCMLVGYWREEMAKAGCH